MAQIEIDGKIMAVGSGKAIYLPAWFCDQLNIKVGQGFTLKLDPKSDERLNISLGNVKKSLDRR